MKTLMLILFLFTVTLFAQPSPLSGKILPDSSLSDVYDKTHYLITSIGVPSGWTGTLLSIEDSDKKAGPFSPYYFDGDTLKLTITGGVNVSDYPGKLLGVRRYFRIRSGTKGLPVTQTDTMKVTVGRQAVN